VRADVAQAASVREVLVMLCEQLAQPLILNVGLQHVDKSEALPHGDERKVCVRVKCDAVRQRFSDAISLVRHSVPPHPEVPSCPSRK
jgi:hypothetical protein